MPAIQVLRWLTPSKIKITIVLTGGRAFLCLLVSPKGKYHERSNTNSTDDDKEDHSLEIACTLSALAAVGDLVTVIGTQELCNDTIRDVGYLIHRHATRINELL